MKNIRLFLPAAFLVILVFFSVQAQEKDGKQKKKSPKPEPLRALLITGGCCHDYDTQKKILMAGIGERTPVKWSLAYEQFDGKDHQMGIYARKDWAEGFDVIVHNECYGGVTDNEFVESMVKEHVDKGVGVVFLHCSMHSYRAAETDAYRKLIGISSFNHGKKHPISVKKVAADHPVIAPVPADWVTVEGELYNSAKVWETATPLAEGTIPSTEGAQTCIWVNEYEGCKVFGTTIGHHNETMSDPVYLDLVTRGLLWTVGKLDQ